MRGGAFNNNQDNARCAYRNRNNPNNRNNNIGFRVVVSTLFQWLPELRCGISSFSVEALREEWRGGFLASILWVGDK
jgi:hypothetical protein